MKKLLLILTLALSMLMLVACGGGGQSTPPTPENKPEDGKINYTLLVRPCRRSDRTQIAE